MATTSYSVLRPDRAVVSSLLHHLLMTSTAPGFAVHISITSLLPPTTTSHHFIAYKRVSCSWPTAPHPT
jgi:hypothetical protein